MNTIHDTLTIYIEDRQDTLQWLSTSVDDSTIEQAIIYITNEIKQKYQTDILTLRDLENQYYELEQLIEFRVPHTFLTIPHRNDVKTLTSIIPRDERYVYQITKNDIRLDKYKGNRKVETRVILMTDILKLNQQYQNTVSNLLDKVDLVHVTHSKSEGAKPSQQQPIQNDPESPKFGQKPNMKESGNDGISPAWMIRKGQQRKSIELKPITKEQLAQHNQPDDAWISINLKVYDVTYYLDKHPGGRDKLMLGVGTDGTALFMEFHPWVNAHYLLEKFQVGFLVNK